MAGNVYLLEDDASICELINCTLELNGITCEAFSTASDFNAALSKKKPDVALIDIMLPDANGLDVLVSVKAAYPDLSCIIISALGNETDKVKGLTLGADDYITKPFGVLELTARIKVALRKRRPSVTAKGRLEIDGESMTAFLDGQPLELNNKEFKLLKFFMDNEGRVLTRETLLNAVWDFDGGETRTVDNHVARLRKLGIPYFETVFGVGYKFKTK